MYPYAHNDCFKMYDLFFSKHQNLTLSFLPRRTILAGAKEVKSWSQGSYSAMIELEIEEDDLDGPVEFVCEVAIPDTDLVFPNATKYEPSE